MIKGILTDFDQTLFNTSSVKPLWRQNPPDWKAVFANIPNLPLYEGWRGVFQVLKDYPFGIVSGNTKTMITKVLKYNKLDFDVVLGRYGEGKRRFRALPKGELFTLAMQHEEFKGLEKSEILYLGDEAVDVEQANAFGFQSGACFWGTLEREELEATSPTYRLYRPSDLLRIVRESNATVA